MPEVGDGRLADDRATGDGDEPPGDEGRRDREVEPHAGDGKGRNVLGIGGDLDQSVQPERIRLAAVLGPGRQACRRTERCGRGRARGGLDRVGCGSGSRRSRSGVRAATPGLTTPSTVRSATTCWPARTCGVRSKYLERSPVVRGDDHLVGVCVPLDGAGDDRVHARAGRRDDVDAVVETRTSLQSPGRSYPNQSKHSLSAGHQKKPRIE